MHLGSPLCHQDDVFVKKCLWVLLYAQLAHKTPIGGTLLTVYILQQALMYLPFAIGNAMSAKYFDG